MLNFLYTFKLQKSMISYTNSMRLHLVVSMHFFTGSTSQRFFFSADSIEVCPYMSSSLNTGNCDKNEYLHFYCIIILHHIFSDKLIFPIFFLFANISFYTSFIHLCDINMMGVHYFEACQIFIDHLEGDGKLVN